jgi:hypothetical protein
MATFRLAFLLFILPVIGGCASASNAHLDIRDAQLILTSASGTVVALDELWRTRSATVLVFWSGECPCVLRYQARVDSLLERYAADQVRVIGISSNAGESLGDVLGVAKERSVRIPIFRDEDGRVAAYVGAHSTPTVVVIDGSGKVRFRGWIDNERLPGEPGREAWLDRALSGILEHRDDFITQTPVYGCAITRSLFGASRCSRCSDPH